MSLRVEDDRHGRDRSRSRTRDRSRSDVARSSLSETKSSKSSKKDREKERDQGRDKRRELEDPKSTRMPGSFDLIDEEASIESSTARRNPAPPAERNYETRAPKDSLAMPAMPLGFDKESDDDFTEGLAYGDDTATRSRSRPIKTHIGPGGVPYPAESSFMPSFPSAHLDDGDDMYAAATPYRYAPAPEKLRSLNSPVASTALPYQYKTDAPKPLTRSRSTSQALKYKPREDVLELKREDANGKSNGKHNRLTLDVNGPQYDLRAPSPSGMDKRMERLSVSGNRPELSGIGRGHAPPASPLLEAYHGTYQQASPMPSPMMLPQDLDDLPDLEALTSRDEGKKSSKEKKRKSVKLYDSEGDAQTLAKALNHHEARPGPLIDIFPGLTHDQMLALRNDYKKLVKTSGRGVNITKQVKMTTSGNFGKAVYATSLGKWESESYWANFWYQSGSSNRELLIEALMGRSNADIREIKDGFRDKRYDDDLSRCMERELKPDKFRMAVLLALEGRRQEETDTYPTEYRNKDVDIMANALRSREGGESAIVQLVVLRSDSHLRECLKTFERMHQQNFAREALRKSNNLVVSGSGRRARVCRLTNVQGEVIAHILNGVINRVARDALLLHHAIEDIAAKERKVAFRYELLMSRLIRLHWDRLHLARVKEEYRSKYQIELDEDIEDTTKGEFRDFLVRLCET